MDQKLTCTPSPTRERLWRRYSLSPKTGSNRDVRHWASTQARRRPGNGTRPSGEKERAVNSRNITEESKCVLLSERSQTRNATFARFHLHDGSGRGKTTEIQNRSVAAVAARGWGGGGRRPRGREAQAPSGVTNELARPRVGGHPTTLLSKPIRLYRTRREP